jgi:peptide deformylase
MIRKILLAGDPRLRTECETISIEDIRLGLAGDSPDVEETLEELLADMHETMQANNGMGLAANQIGYMFRLFIMLDSDPKGYREYFNPEVISQEEEVSFDNEGCLSIPGVTAKTKRFRKLTLQWQDKEGTTHKGAFEDIRAFAVQHEMDHINGKLYIDQFSLLERRHLVKKHEKYMRNLRRG